MLHLDVWPASLICTTYFCFNQYEQYSSCLRLLVIFLIWVYIISTISICFLTLKIFYPFWTFSFAIISFQLLAYANCFVGVLWNIVRKTATFCLAQRIRYNCVWGHNCHISMFMFVLIAFDHQCGRCCW